MIKTLLATLLTGMALLVSGCGKSGGGGGSSVNNANTNICPAGAVNTQHGCLNQTGCPVGYGNLNGQCVPALSGSTQQCQAGFVFSNQYGCLQQGQCPAGYGLYQNQCVIANSTGIGHGTVQPVHPGIGGGSYYGGG
ncbi:MAG: hypothetical protein ACK5W9_08775, partial [Bdellovibrionales bacterium]